MTAVKSKSVVSRSPEIVTARILDAAQAEFMATGYEAASTNRITDAFGGSKATIFRYFPTKEKMLEAVIRRIAGRWRETVAREGMPELAPREWLELYASRILSWLLSEESLFLGRLAVAEGHKFPDLSLVFEETASKPLQRILEQRLAAWTRLGLLTSRDPKNDAVHFLDLLIGGPVSRALYHMPDPSDREMKRHIRRGIDLFLHGCAVVGKLRRSRIR
jgi:AcrR family transcriptional regulator